MSRRIVMRNAKTLDRKKQMKWLSETKVITFDEEEMIENLEFQYIKIQLLSSLKIKEEIDRLKKLAAFRKLGYLASCQYTIPTPMFIINTKIKDSTIFHEQYNRVQDFSTYINPQIVQYKTEKRPTPEECHSFPFFQAIVDRAHEIQVRYNDDSLKPKTETLSGFKAQLFQHCYDHTCGSHFMSPLMSRGRLKISEFSNFLQNTSFFLREYNLRVKDAIEKGSTNTQKFLKTKQNYINKIAKAFREQSIMAQQQFKKGTNSKLY